MRDIHHIIEEYRQSDLKKRVFLFIEFRELRREFTDIDRKEGFVELKGVTDPVIPYTSEVRMIGRTLTDRLKRWKHRFKEVFQGST